MAESKFRDGRHAAAGLLLDGKLGLARGGDGYPPYDIERLLSAPERIRVTLAVAGFSLDELEVQIAGSELTIRGRQVDRPGAEYLFRGIAARQFQRIFMLAPGMEVLSASLSHGLLRIDLHQPSSEQAVRKINISTSQ